MEWNAICNMQCNAKYPALLRHGDVQVDVTDLVTLLRSVPRPFFVGLTSSSSMTHILILLLFSFFLSFCTVLYQYLLQQLQQQPPPYNIVPECRSHSSHHERSPRTTATDGSKCRGSCATTIAARGPITAATTATGIHL
jgi:hypothetical protein